MAMTPIEKAAKLKGVKEEARRRAIVEASVTFALADVDSDDTIPLGFESIVKIMMQGFAMGVIYALDLEGSI